MRRFINLFLVLALFLMGCGQNIEDSTSKPTDQFKMSLSYEITPEDLDNRYFAISWEDTLGRAIGIDSSNWHARPVEIWCKVFSTDPKSKLLGAYTGMSTPSRFTYFEAIDSTVSVQFFIGPNQFSEAMTKEMIAKMNLPIAFEPIRISLKDHLRVRREIVLEAIN